MVEARLRAVPGEVFPLPVEQVFCPVAEREFITFGAAIPATWLIAEVRDAPVADGVAPFVLHGAGCQGQFRIAAGLADEVVKD